MLGGRGLRGGVSRLRLAAAVAFAAVAAGFLGVAWYVGTPLSPVAVALFALTLVYILATAFDAIRTHDLFPLASAVFTLLLFTGWYVVARELMVLGFAAFALLGVLVEAYNYWQNTAILRFEKQSPDGD